MEGYDEQHVQGDSARAAGDGAAPGSTSRWNPTKEQINMLENFYRQGIRTPSAEQIQQLTSRLRAYGHIEGKNVFYWFQNHKARQRQKQKQESMAYLNHFFHRAAQPMFPPPPPPLNHHPCPNVMCSPYYIPVQNELGFYQQSPYPNKVPFPCGAKRKPRTEKSVKPRTTRTGDSGYEPMPHGYSTSGGGYMINDVANESTAGRCDQETLPLFPLQPTGILQGREYQNPSCGSGTANYADNSTAALIGSNSEIVGDQPFYDFFSG